MTVTSHPLGQDLRWGVTPGPLPGQPQRRLHGTTQEGQVWVRGSHVTRHSWTLCMLDSCSWLLLVSACIATVLCVVRSHDGRVTGHLQS